MNEPADPPNPPTPPAPPTPRRLIGMEPPGELRAHLDLWLDSFVRALQQVNSAPDPETVRGWQDGLVELVKQMDEAAGVIVLGTVFRLVLMTLERRLGSGGGGGGEVPWQPGSEKVN